MLELRIPISNELYTNEAFSKENHTHWVSHGKGYWTFHTFTEPMLQGEVEDLVREDETYLKYFHKFRFKEPLQYGESLKLNHVEYKVDSVYPDLYSSEWIIELEEVR